MHINSIFDEVEFIKSLNEIYIRIKYLVSFVIKNAKAL